MSRVRVTAQARFGGGLSEKERKRYLAGSLPYLAKPFPFLEGEGETAEQSLQSEAAATADPLSPGEAPKTPDQQADAQAEEAFRYQAVTQRQEGEKEARQGILF